MNTGGGNVYLRNGDTLPVVEVTWPLTGCASIGDGAFKNCAGLTKIRIPAECALGEDVFEGCGKVYVFSAAESKARTYCQSHDNCVFVEDDRS